MTIPQAFAVALEYHQTGRTAEAESIYKQILAVDPRHAGALHLLGVIAFQSGHDALAVDLIREAIALDPGVPDFHCNLGAALRTLGQLEAAIAACRRAIVLKPDLPEAYLNLGNALRDASRLEEATVALRHAVALRPDSPDAHNNLGNALRDAGHLREAIAAYREAIALRPHFAEAYNNLGAGLSKNGQPEDAVVAYRQALALKPNYAEAHSNLGVVLCERGRFEEGIAAYQQAIALNPNHAEAHNNLGLALWTQGELDGAIAAYREAIAVRPAYAEAHSNLLLALHGHPVVDAASLAEESQRWQRLHAEPLSQYTQPHPNDRAPERRLRIGYVSPDLREHPVGRFLLPLLAAHDHEHFEVFCYAQVAAPDLVTGQLRAHASHWHSLAGLSDDQAAALIRQHRIDILVDLSGHTAHHRLLLFARKPAPVQVTFLGYPGTTGLTAIDYRITDAFADPPGENEAWHAERLIRLAPCAWCYQPTHFAEIPALPAGPIVFGCCNKLAKITEPMLALWAQLLRAVPDSTLLLKAPALESESTRRIVERKLAKAGLGPARVVLRGYEPRHDAHLAVYERITVALDTFPYHGTTTTCEALWMGVPVVTLAGQTHVSRVGVSLLSNAGLADLVAGSEEEYVSLAVGLAQDAERLADLRHNLRSRLEQSPLLDAPAYAREIEVAYRRIWRTWAQTGA